MSNHSSPSRTRETRNPFSSLGILSNIFTLMFISRGHWERKKGERKKGRKKGEKEGERKRKDKKKKKRKKRKKRFKNQYKQQFDLKPSKSSKTSICQQHFSPSFFFFFFFFFYFFFFFFFFLPKQKLQNKMTRHQSPQ